jgi:hypothetical protein
MTTSPTTPETTGEGKTRSTNQWYKNEKIVKVCTPIFQASIEQSLEEDGGVSSFAELHRRVQKKEAVDIPEDHLRWFLEELGLADLFTTKRKISLPKTYRGGIQAGTTSVPAPAQMDDLAAAVAADLLEETVPVRSTAPSAMPGPAPLGTLAFASPAARQAGARG